jgi:hypothetical protein
MYFARGSARTLGAPRTWAGSGSLTTPLAASLLVLVAALFAGAPMCDVATLHSIPDVYLDRPGAYIAVAPFSDVLDAISLLSERQHVAILLGLVALWSVHRFAWAGSLRADWLESIRSFAVLLVAVVAVYAAAAYLPRPMAYLVSADPDVLRIDFHSHTQSSRDARRSYSVENNRKWHEAGGYDVAYVTDHGTFVGAERGLANDPSTWNGGVILLGGIEANWKGEHVGVLGEEQAVRRLLSADLHDIDLRARATTDSRSSRAPIMMWNHPRDSQLRALPLASGVVQAIEVANGAPRGMDLVWPKRQQIVDLARQHNLALLSGTDSHGWGFTAPNWTLLRIKGWRRLDRDELASQIARAVRIGGFGATHVVERAPADSGTSAVALALSVFVVPWHMLTELSPGERGMWLVWIWVIAVAELQLRRRRPLEPSRAAAQFP